MFNIEQARKFLTIAGVFIGYNPEEDDDDPEMAQAINLNDAFFWACADAEYVPDEELPEVARLFWWYGWCGILYWASEKNDQVRAEFQDINRFIDFVRMEESIVKEEPKSNKRAYLKKQYVLGIEEQNG